MTDEAMLQRLDTFEVEMRAQLELLRSDVEKRVRELLDAERKHVEKRMQIAEHQIYQRLADLVGDRMSEVELTDEQAEFVAYCNQRSERRAALRAAANEPPPVPTAEDEADGQ